MFESKNWPKWESDLSTSNVAAQRDIINVWYATTLIHNVTNTVWYEKIKTLSLILCYNWRPWNVYTPFFPVNHGNWGECRSVLDNTGLRLWSLNSTFGYVERNVCHWCQSSRTKSKSKPIHYFCCVVLQRKETSITYSTIIMITLVIIDNK